MRLVSGASLSVVKSGTWPPILFSESVDDFGSTALTMIADTPPATRSSISRCCTAAAACSGYFSERS
jgi:hypothetical protein